MTNSPEPVLTLLGCERVDDNDATHFLLRIKDGCTRRLARSLADRIVYRLTLPSPSFYSAWQRRANGGPEHDDLSRQGLEAFVMSDFRTESAERDGGTRLLGAVVEHLWASVATSLDGRWGLPMHVEHDHFSVIDHGPDGLSVYDDEGGQLRFRLWESKHHTGQKSLTIVFSGAAGQLKQNAAVYLAQISKPLQLNGDDRLQDLAAELVPLWLSGDQRSAVGVSVGRSSSDLLPMRPLRGLARAFGDREIGGREAVLMELGDLRAFAAMVRAEVLRGVS